MATTSINVGSVTFRKEATDSAPVKDNSPLSFPQNVSGNYAAFFWIGDPTLFEAFHNKVVRGITIKGKFTDRDDRGGWIVSGGSFYTDSFPLTLEVSGGTRKHVVDYSHPTSTTPIRPIQAADGTRTTGRWGGILVTVTGDLDVYEGGKVDAVKWDGSATLHVSDRASVSFTCSSSVGVGNKAQFPLVGTLEYPDGDKVAGVEVRVYTTGSKVRFAPAGSSVTPSASVNVTSDTSGQFEVDIYGMEKGTASVNIVAVDNAQAYCFDPVLARYFPIDVFGAGEETPPDEPGTGGISIPPPEPPPGSGNPPEPPSVDPVTECITYPAREGVPEVPSRTVYHNDFSWNAGANSVDTVEGDAVCTFTIGKVVGVVIGFTQDLDVHGGYSRMSHAFYFHQDANGDTFYRIMEDGAAKTPAAAYIADETVFVLRRVDTAVVYLVDNVVVFESRVPSSGTLSVGSALYATGDIAP